MGTGAGLAAQQAQSESQRHADQLRDKDDTEQGGPAGQQAAAEVARSPGDRRQETEDDRRVRRAAEVDQVRPLGAGTAAGAGAGATASATSGVPSIAPSSTLVGPSSTTTASAASS